MPLLLDTCAIIWISGGEPVAGAAIDEMTKTGAGGISTFISPISAWELGLLVSKGRLPASVNERAWLGKLLLLPEVEYSDLSPDVLIDSSYLPGTPPSDPADRIIIATARQQGLRIMTRDRKILDYADAGHVNAIPC